MRVRPCRLPGALVPEVAANRPDHTRRDMLVARVALPGDCCAGKPAQVNRHRARHEKPLGELSGKPAGASIMILMRFLYPRQIAGTKTSPLNERITTESFTKGPSWPTRGTAVLRSGRNSVRVEYGLDVAQTGYALL